MGVILLFVKDKKKVSKYDHDFAGKLRRTYFEQCSIEKTFECLFYDYENKNPYMCRLLENTIEYLNGDYGDYETALDMVNPELDEDVKKAGEEILKAELSKKWALPMSE